MGLREDILRQQEEDRKNAALLANERTKLAANRQSGLLEFAGQTLWGATESLTFGLPGLADVATGQEYEDSWEHALSLGGPAEWEDLSGWGKSGYIFGSALGLLPTFGVAGILGRGTAKGIGKVGGIGVKSLKKHATKEFLEASGKITSGHADDIVKTLTKTGAMGEKTVAAELMDDVYRVAGKGSVADDLGRVAGSQWYKTQATSDIAVSIGKTLNLQEPKVVNQLAAEAFEIFTRNNPVDAANMMRAMVRRIPGLDNKGGKLLGVMAYESLIGLNIGIMRAATNNIYRTATGYEGPDGYGYKPEGSYFIDTMKHGLDEAAWFSLIGPVKFIKGGSSKSLIKKANELFVGVGRALRPVKNMTHQELKIAIRGIDVLQGGSLNASMGAKWAAKGRDWIENATVGEGTNEMRKFLREARLRFLKGAPGQYAKEFGEDMLKSIPRMGMGVLAMNAHGLFSYYANGGNGLPFNALGRDPHEIIGNIMTAAYFSRRPHSFHDKNPIKFMQSGKIDEYFSGKASELRKTTGSLNMFARNYDGKQMEHMDRILAKYMTKPADSEERGRNVTNHSITSSSEMNELRKILEPHSLKEGQNITVQDPKDPSPRFTTLEDAVNDYISKNLAGKDKVALRQVLTEQLYVAAKIIDLHNQHTFEQIHMDSITSEGAVSVVEKISNIKFGAKPLNYATLIKRIPKWIIESITANTMEPMGITKRFLKDMYTAMGLEHLIIEKDGKFLAARVQDLKDAGFTNTDLLEAFATVYERGKGDGWLIEDIRKADADKIEMNNDKLVAMEVVWERSKTELMDYTHGQGWADKGVEMDHSILQNASWHLAYRSITDIQQADNSRALLTRSKDHNMNATEAGRLFDELNATLFSRENPGIDYVGDAADAAGVHERGNLDKFITRLHAGIKSLNPQITKKTGNALTEKQAMELKDKVEKLVGDTFSSDESYNFFERYSFEESVEKLGIADMRVGFDTKTALILLHDNENFNYGEPGQFIFPSLNKIRENLNAAVKSKKITKAARKEYLDFYRSLFDSVNEADLGIIKFSDSYQEKNEGDWAASIKMAKMKALTRVGGRLSQEASTTANYAFQAAHTLEQRIKLLEHGYFEMTKDEKASVDKFKAIVSHNRRVLANLAAELKEAVDTNDAITLHAYASGKSTLAEIQELMKKIEITHDATTQEGYLKTLIDLKNNALKKIHTAGWKQSTIDELVSQKLQNRYSEVGEKDVTDSPLRISKAQFSIRYGLNAIDIDNIFAPANSARIDAKELRMVGEAILVDYYSDPASIKNKNLRATTEQMIATMEKAAEKAGMIDMDADAFHQYIYAPLKLRIELDRQQARDMKHQLKISDETVEADIYSLVASYFSTRPLKQLQIDLVSNTLSQTRRPYGYSPDRGLTGLIDALEGIGSTQRWIYPIMQKMRMSDGYVRNLMTRADRQDLQSKLMNGDFKIRDIQGEAEFYALGKTEKIIDTDYTETFEGNEFRLISLDEKTDIIVRMDKDIKGNIAATYNKGTGNNDGGALYKRLEAIVSAKGNDITTNKRLLSLIDSLQESDKMTHKQAADAILLTRIILDMPSFVERAVDQHGNIDIDSAEFKERWKRLGMTQSKNGYIGTPENLSKTAIFYKKSNSAFYKSIYKAVKDWIEPKNGKYRKLKVLSIDDNAEYKDPSIVNVLNSIERMKVQLEERVTNNEIDEHTRDYQLARFEDLTKSIMDGEMFVSKDVLLASYAMRGVTRDMVDYNDKTGKIRGFKSGAIKPSLTHIDVSWKDPSASNYGEVYEWYGKTAFKYVPEMDAILKKYKVDAITFHSANKINEHKASSTSSWDVDSDGKSTRYAIPEGIDKNDLSRKGLLDQDVPTFLLDDVNLNVTSQSITEIPFSSINLRSVSREHLPMVGSNTAVHMRSDNGLKEWIGLENKIASLSNTFQNQYKDIYFRTALADRVFGAAAESGDNVGVRTGIDAVLDRKGLMTDPWMQKRLEESLINYYLNNGNVGAGIVPDGSIDVMSADLGNLKTPVRRKFIIGRGKEVRAVQFFGEFQMSHYGGQRKFELYGEGRGDIQSTIIQKIRYQSDARSVNSKGETIFGHQVKDNIADGFLIRTSNGEQYLIIEGMAIDKSGRLLDLDGIERNRLIYLDANVEAPGIEKYNKNIFEIAVEEQNEFLKWAKDQDAITMSDYAELLHRWSKGRRVKGPWTTKIDPPRGGELGLGLLNSRQPRNMMGDIVINRAKTFENKKGDIISTVDKRSGNISRMNHADAISPQDADFDMDKSFAYTAAHGNFWVEAGRLAGYDLTHGNEIRIGEDFDLIFQEGAANMIDSVEGFTWKEAITEGNLHRGMFVKMHQTATYLSNIFRDDPNVMHFTKEAAVGIGQRFNETFTVRVKGGAAYISTVDNISKWVTRYIDEYKHALSEGAMERTRDIQYDILFGKDGIFEVVDAKGNTMEGIDLSSSGAFQIKEAIVKRFVLPINRYLVMNKGVTTDNLGEQRKARLPDFNHTYLSLLRAINTEKPFALIAADGDGMNLKPGLRAASTYFANSNAPFDYSMRGLHNIYDQMYGIKKESKTRRGLDPIDDLLEYIDRGLDTEFFRTLEGEDAKRVKLNEIYQLALTDFVSDQSRALQIVDLAGKLKSVQYNIDEAERFGKTDNLIARADYQALLERKSRMIEVKTILESALTTKWGEPLDMEMEVKKHKGFDERRYYNNGTKPIVVLSSKHKMVEVILPGEKNFNKINPWDIMIENGRRFEVTDPIEQGGLRAIYERLGGLPGYTDASGKKHVLSREQWEQIILPVVRKIHGMIRDVQSRMVTSGKDSWGNFAREKRAIILDVMAQNFDIRSAKTPEEADLYKFGIIAQLLSPRVQDKVISIRKIMGNHGRRAVMDLKFLENPYAETIYSMLTEIENGSQLSAAIDKGTAKEFLDNITKLKKVGHVASKNKFIDIELLESRYFTEPADIIDGYLSKEKHLSKDVFKALEDSDQNTRRAAQIMVDYARGNRLLDGRTLYLASKQLEKAGVPVDEQFIRTQAEVDTDGIGKIYGDRVRIISEIDTAPHRNWGTGSSIHESVSKRTREQFKCFEGGE